MTLNSTIPEPLLPIPDGAAHDLRQMHDELVAVGVTTNDRVVILIDLCITLNLDRRGLVLQALESLGYRRGNIMPIFTSKTGDNPTRCHWKRDAGGRYSSHGTIA